MTPTQVRRDLQRFAEVGLRSGFAISARTPSLIDRDNGVSCVATAVPQSVDRKWQAGAFGTVAEYRYLLESNDYLVVLIDGSVLQASYTFRHGRLIGHRLAFFPCPVDLTLSQFDPEVESLAEHVETALVLDESWKWPLEDSSESSHCLRMRGPIRFDYDTRGAADHPIVHLHLSAASGRIPVYGPLSPGHFFSFVTRFLCPEVWGDYQHELTGWPLRSLARTIVAPDETSLLHLEWRRGA